MENDLVPPLDHTFVRADYVESQFRAEKVPGEPETSCCKNKKMIQNPFGHVKRTELLGQFEVENNTEGNALQYI